MNGHDYHVEYTPTNKEGLFGAYHICKYNAFANGAGTFTFFGGIGYLTRSLPRF